jgi:thiol reductant ABC exporter CydC subunit
VRVYLRLLGFLRPYWWRIALATLLGVATVASNIGLLAVSAYVISAAAVVPYLFMISLPVFLVRLFSVSRAGARYTSRMVSHDVTFRLLARVRTWFYERLEPLSPAVLSRYRSGDLLSRIAKDVEELENVYLRSFSPVAVALVISLLTASLLYLFDSTLAVVVLAFLAFTGVGVPVLVGYMSAGLGREQLVLRAELSARIVDGIQGVEDILAFGREEDERRGVARLQGELDRTQRRMSLVAGLQGFLTDVMMNLALVATLLIAIPEVASGATGGVYLAVLALVVLGSFEAIAPLGEAFQTLGRSIAAGERLFEIADTGPQVVDPVHPAPSPENVAVEFENVAFRYQGPEGFELEGITFSLRPGSRVAVVGASGSGKSTLVNLILRFWDPETGVVRLGGRDLREYAQRDLRARLAVVPQDTHVFDGTLRDNLLLSRPGATEAEVRLAVEAAQLSGFVGSLPGGLDGHVGEHGLRISGGERQRLAVARALLRDAPLLVLDEPTANLDTITERDMLAAVRAAMEGRITLMITHRLVAMEEMDEILVLDRGRIVERGTHVELVRSGGLYRRMLDVQGGILGAA